MKMEDGRRLAEPAPSLAKKQPAIQHSSRLLSAKPFYKTKLGAAYCGDSQTLLKQVKESSVDLVVTSPPYALHFKKEYGNVHKDDYVQWLKGFATEIYRVLKPSGSFVLNIGGSYNAGSPTRSTYHFKALLMLCEEVKFHLAQECFWYNPAKLPSPAEWVTVRRIRIKDSVEYVWWFSKSEHPKADNRRVLAPYSNDMLRLIQRGYRAKMRPSGHNITGKFQKNLGGSIPANVIERGNNESNSSYIKRCAETGQAAHPARFPAALPEFFVKLLTEENDVVLDPFAGSNMTGSTAEQLNRRWLAFELEKRYVSNSKLRFEKTKQR
jgi:DNA modification methylase